jgi:ComF family protein
MRLSLDKLVGVIAPHQCLACGLEGSLLCDSCMQTAGEPLVPRCVGCHKLSDKFKTCKSCKSWLLVDSVFVSTSYEGVYEELLFAMKFDSKRQAAEPIAKIMAEAGTYEFEDSLLCPVPTASSRVRQRGFDHTKLISSHLANHLLMQKVDCLGRNSNIRQFGANRTNRLKQMQNEFYVNKDIIVEGKNILLVDDVVTTGATLSSCAAILKKAGAKSVKAIVFTQKV